MQDFVSTLLDAKLQDVVKACLALQALAKLVNLLLFRETWIHWVVLDPEDGSFFAV